MKRKTIGALLAGVICAVSVAPAGAVHVTDVAGLGALAAATAVADVLGSEDVNAAPPVQDEQSVGFRGLEETVRAHNQTIQAFKKTLQGIENTDLDGQFFAEELQYQAQLNEYQSQANAYTTYIKELKAVGR